MRKLIKLFTIFTITTLVGCSVVHNTNKPSKVASIQFNFPKMMAKRSSLSHTKADQSHKKWSHERNIKSQIAKSAYIRHTHKTLQNFDKLLVDGNIDVELHSNFSKPSVLIKGDLRYLAALTVEVKDHTLVLYAGAGIPASNPVKVIVKGRYINSIRLKTNARIKGDAFKSNYLNIDVKDRAAAHLAGYMMINRINIQDQGRVKLEGVHSKYLEVHLKDKANLTINGKANLAKLNASDHTYFSMAWVDSSNLTSKITGNAYVQLAGVVNKLDVCIYGHAQWNGRYLRSQRTYVKTFDYAVARISAVHKQHTLARDRSNIYFYNLPTYRTDFMANDGSVLDMRNWRQRAWNDYDIYNKAS